MADIERELWIAYSETLLTYRDEQNYRRTLTPVLGDCDPWPWRNDLHEIFVLSAANPYSELMSEDVNVDFERRLKHDLEIAGYKYRPCHGASPDGKWVERSVMIINAPSGAIEKLGNKYEQNAYFRWTPETWEVVSLVSDQHLVSDWELR